MKRLLLSLIICLLPVLAQAQIKINALPSGATPSSGDYTICDQSGVTNKCTFAQVLAYIQASLNIVPIPSFINGDCLSNNGTSFLWTTCGGGGGSTAFSALTSGGNTTAAMVVGSGATLTRSGTGVIDANQINSAIVPASAPIAATNSSGQVIAIAASATTTADLAAVTPFTIAGTGCTPTVTAAGPFSGIITMAAGPCTTVTITINGATGFTAANGFYCNVVDQTAMNAGNFIPVWGEKSSTTHVVVIPIPAAVGTTDAIRANCGYNQ